MRTKVQLWKYHPRRLLGAACFVFTGFSIRFSNYTSTESERSFPKANVGPHSSVSDEFVLGRGNVCLTRLRVITRASSNFHSRNDFQFRLRRLEILSRIYEVH